MRPATRGTLVVGLVTALTAAPSAAVARPHHHSHCKDRSPTLGRRVCSKFGAWSTVTRFPPLTSELLVGLRILGLPVSSASASPGARLATPPASSSRYLAPGVGMRWTLGLRRGLYLGFGVEGGPVFEGRKQPTGTTAPVDFYAAGTVHAGFRQHAGPLQLSAELGTGAMIVPVAPAGPAVDPAAMEPVDLHGRFVLEARARADAWINPWFTLGGFAAVDLQGRGVAGGMQFGMHLRAFDTGR